MFGYISVHGAVRTTPLFWYCVQCGDINQVEETVCRCGELRENGAPAPIEDVLSSSKVGLFNPIYIALLEKAIMLEDECIVEVYHVPSKKTPTIFEMGRNWLGSRLRNILDELLRQSGWGRLGPD